MKRGLHFIFSIALLMTPISDFSQFKYISPMPGSKFHHIQTNIILKNGGYIQSSSLKSNLVSIRGTKSGDHHARIVLSGDKKTILIYPEPIFESGESVAVTINDGFKKTDGSVIHGITFQFDTRPDWNFTSDGVNKKDTSSDLRDDCALIPYTIISTANAYKADAFYYNFRNSNPKCWARTILSNAGD